MGITPPPSTLSKVTVAESAEDSGRGGVTVVVPVSERPRDLVELYEEFAPAVRSVGEPWEFVFVVSPWGRELVRTLRPLQEAGEPIRVLEVGPRAGETGMLIAGAAQASGDILVTLPPYFRVTPDSLPRLVALVRRGELDLASARRAGRHDSWFNRLQNRVFHTLLAGATGGGFSDVASGVRAFRRKLLDEIALYGDFFRFLPLLARSEGFRVEEITVPQHEADTRARVYGLGIYLRRMIDLLGLFFLIRFTQKPLRFFGLVGSAFAGLGGVILVVLTVQRLLGQAISDRPLLLLGVMLFVVGIQAVSIGLVGEIIVHFGATRTRLYRVAEITGDDDEGST